LTRFDYSQLHMGVQVKISVYARDRAQAEKACEAAFARFAELEAIMSDYRPDSELMRLCETAVAKPVPVSRDLFIILKHSLEVARDSEGAFDITVGPYVQLWRRARRGGPFPTNSELEAARQHVGWQHVRLDPEKRTVRLLIPGMRLDLGGIAKGYGGDCAIAVLKKHGIKRALVEAGGDIVVSNAPPGEKGWPIEIENSAREESHVTLANRAISTSGDTVQYLEYAGRRYSHVVDPRTGLGLTQHLAATVVASNGMTSDSLSTAITVLGQEKGEKLARKYRATSFIRRVAGD
jgi:FAD:protein FMN transferase